MQQRNDVININDCDGRRVRKKSSKDLDVGNLRTEKGRKQSGTTLNSIPAANNKRERHQPEVKNKTQRRRNIDARVMTRDGIGWEGSKERCRIVGGNG